MISSSALRARRTRVTVFSGSSEPESPPSSPERRRRRRRRVPVPSEEVPSSPEPLPLVGLGRCPDAVAGPLSPLSLGVAVVGPAAGPCRRCRSRCPTRCRCLPHRSCGGAGRRAATAAGAGLLVVGARRPSSSAPVVVRRGVVAHSSPPSAAAGPVSVSAGPRSWRRAPASGCSGFGRRAPAARGGRDRVRRLEEQRGRAGRRLGGRGGLARPRGSVASRLRGLVARWSRPRPRCRATGLERGLGRAAGLLGRGLLGRLLGGLLRGGPLGGGLLGGRLLRGASSPPPSSRSSWRPARPRSSASVRRAPRRTAARLGRPRPARAVVGRQGELRVGRGGGLAGAGRGLLGGLARRLLRGRGRRVVGGGWSRRWSRGWSRGRSRERWSPRLPRWWCCRSRRASALLGSRDAVTHGVRTGAMSVA